MRHKQLLVCMATSIICMPLIARAAGDEGSDKDPVKKQQLVNQLGVSVADAIRAAEQRTGGKATCAEVCTLRCIRNAGGPAYDTDRMTGMESKNGMDHPVVKVVCVSDNVLKEVVVCGKSGEVVGTRMQFVSAQGKDSRVDKRYIEPGEDGKRTGDEAGDRTRRPMDNRDSWFRPATRWQKLTDMKGKNVQLSTGTDKVGDIKEVAMEPDAGRVLYYVVEFKDSMNLGNRWYAIPISAVRLTEDNKAVVLNFSPSQINKENGFDPKNWPDLTSERTRMQIYSSYGQRPYWETPAGEAAADWRRPPGRYEKGIDLLGREVRNPQNEKLGALDDIVIDPDSGRILYAVLSYGGILGMGDKLFAIPWTSLKPSVDRKHLVLDIDKQRLKDSEGFDKKNWPDMADNRWATTIHDYYGQPRYWDRDRDPRPGQ